MLQPTKATLFWELPFEGAWTTSVAFVGNDTLAAANQLGELYLWRLPAAKGDAPPPARRLEGHTNGITHLLTPGDGKTLISTSLDRTIRIWNVEAPAAGTGEAIMDRERREQEARRGKKDALAAPGVKVELVKESTVLAGHSEWIRAAGLSADGKRLITGDDGSAVMVWDVAGRKQIASWKGQPWCWAVAVALSPDGQTALVSEYRYKRDDFDVPAPALRLWNVADGKEKLDILKVQFPKFRPDASSYDAAQVWRKFVADGLVTAAFSPDGKIVAVGQGGETDTGKAHLIDAATGKLLRTVSGHRYGMTHLLFSADGKYLLTTGRDTTVRILEVADGKQVAELGKPRGGQFKDWLHAIALSPDEKWLAAADISGKVAVYRFGS